MSLFGPDPVEIERSLRERRRRNVAATKAILAGTLDAPPDPEAPEPSDLTAEQ